MKKLLLSVMLLGLFSGAMAQKSELSSAKNNYALFEVSMQTKSDLKKKLETLELAKASIDKATVHDKTKDNPEAWTYKAIIYSAIAVNDTINVEKANAAFATAQEAIVKAKELDKEGENKTNIESSERNLSIVMQNKGIAAFNKKDYKGAYTAFKYISDIMPKDSTFSMYTAMAANSAQMPDEAIKYYQKTLDINTANPGLYQELGRLYLAKADTAAALKTFQAGRAIHPENSNLMFDELNIYINRGQIASQISKIEAAIAKEPSNKTLYFVLGIAQSSNNEFDKAAAAYQKALEIDPSYGDAIYNLSIIYINKGNVYITEANKLPAGKASDAKYNALKVKFESELKKAQPLLEKARELNPKDANVLTTLREVYAKLGQMDKAAQLKKEIDQL